MSQYLSRGEGRGRILAADAALVIDETDGQIGTIRVSTTTGTKAATFTWAASVSAQGGARFQISCYTASGGSYTVACTYGITAGTVTIDALHECPQFHRIGSTLFCTALGGATFA